MVIGFKKSRHDLFCFGEITFTEVLSKYLSDELFSPWVDDEDGGYEDEAPEAMWKNLDGAEVISNRQYYSETGHYDEGSSVYYAVKAEDLEDEELRHLAENDEYIFQCVVGDLYGEDVVDWERLQGDIDYYDDVLMLLRGQHGYYDDITEMYEQEDEEEEEDETDL